MQKRITLMVVKYRLWKCLTDDLDHIKTWDKKLAYTSSSINAELVNDF